jgi:ankyrin repeat protein
LDAIISLIAHDNTTIQTADNDNELPLHKACRGGHLAKIQYLLDKFAPASGIRNALGYLPLHILIRKSGKADISMMNTPAFTETVFKLLQAYPESVMV